MIYTITFNPSLDYFIYLSQPFQEGAIMRSEKSDIRVGGKGINISLTLANLGIKTVVITFIGGIIGSFIEQVISDIPNIELRKVNISEENRINIKIRNTNESAINAKGPLVDRRQQDQLLERLKDLRKEDYVVVSGSYCRGVDVQLVSRIGQMVRSVGAKLITDIPDLRFADLKAIRPYMIKPNIEELADIFQAAIDVHNYPAYVEKLLDAGVENVLLSIGSPGSYFASKERRYRLSGPPIKVVSTVGCGDSMLAYMLSRLSIGDDKKTAVRYGEAAGRVKAGSKDLIDPIDVKKMTDAIKVEEVEIS